MRYPPNISFLEEAQALKDIISELDDSNPQAAKEASDFLENSNRSNSMKRIILAVTIFCIFSSTCLAVITTPFSDTDTYIKIAGDIVIAKCISVPKQEFIQGLVPAEVEVIKVLKGNRKPGSLPIAVFPGSVTPNNTYMLYSFTGGKTLGTDFLAKDELSVIPLPASFDIEELENKDLKEQVQYVFSRYLFEVERALAPLLAQKQLLEKAISDREYEVYDSKGPVKLSTIKEIVTQTSDESSFLIWLNLDGEKIEWSVASMGMSGYFYHWKIGTTRPYWEYSMCDVDNIEQLEGKHIKTKFYGMYTPGNTSATQHIWNNGLSVGKVLLARNVDNPDKIYAIEIIKQEQDKAQMTARYTVINQ